MHTWCPLLTVIIAATFASVLCQSTDNAIARGFDAKGMLTSLAGSLMSRGYGATGSGASQIVSLNLTNLLVLVLLKALIFAAGSLGAGTWKGGYARSIDGEEKILTEEEVLLFISYLSGAPGEYGCLKQIACKDSQQAKRYAVAGDMLLKAAKMFSIQADYYDYEYALKELEQAANAGSFGENCEKFVCGKDQTNNT